MHVLEEEELGQNVSMVDAALKRNEAISTDVKSRVRVYATLDSYEWNSLGLKWFVCFSTAYILTQFLGVRSAYSNLLKRRQASCNTMYILEP